MNRRQREAGLLVAGCSAALWLAFGLANGPAQGNDTSTYLRVVDAFTAGRIISSIRTPGYPLFLLGCRALSALLGVETAGITLVVQTLLLAGGATWLVYWMAMTLTGRTSAGLVAALLLAADVDVQQFGMTLLSEALTTTCTVLAVCVRLRDSSWRRAGWLLAFLALLRPNFVIFPVVFAVVEGLHRRRVGPALAAIAPSAVVLGLWGAIAIAAGADPLRPQRWFVPMHAFGTVYETGLWRKLPDGPARRLLAAERARGDDPYAAAAVLRDRLGPDAVGRVAVAAIAADPVGYLRIRVRLLPLAFRQPSFLRRELVQPAHPRPRLLGEVAAWHRAYRHVLYASFPFFLVLMASACWWGLGWPGAIESFRTVIGPFVAMLFVSVSASSLSSYDVGRLALPFRPFYCLALGLATSAGIERGRRVARTLAAGPRL